MIDTVYVFHHVPSRDIWWDPPKRHSHESMVFHLKPRLSYLPWLFYWSTSKPDTLVYSSQRLSLEILPLHTQNPRVTWIIQSCRLRVPIHALWESHTTKFFQAYSTTKKGCKKIIDTHTHTHPAPLALCCFGVVLQIEVLKLHQALLAKSLLKSYHPNASRHKALPDEPVGRKNMVSNKAPLVNDPMVVNGPHHFFNP